MSHDNAHAPALVDVAAGPSDDGWSPGERQDAARNAYLASLDAGRPLTGAQLGERFGRTDRWGRLQIRKFRAELDATTDGSRLEAGNDHDRSVRSDGNGTTPEPALVHQPARRPSGEPEAGSPGATGRNATVVPLAAPSAAPARRKRNGNDAGSEPEPRAVDVSVPPTPDVTPAEPPRPAADSGNRAAEASSRSWLDLTNKVVLAVVCAAASYGHMYHVALLAGEPLWIARAWPITVDGLVIAALRRGDEGRRWLALGIAVSIAANVLAQFPELAASAGPFVSAWPPIALYGTHRLSHPRRRPRADDSPAEVAAA